MNIRSIRFRLTAWYSALLVALGLAFGAYCYFRLDHFLSLYLREFFSHRAERIAESLLTNVEQKGETYFDSEIESRYAPETFDRFMRVTTAEGKVVYISNEPNDQSFDPAKISLPSTSITHKTTRVERVGKIDLLIVSFPCATKDQKYIIEVGGSDSETKAVLHNFLVAMLIGLFVVLAVANWGDHWSLNGLSRRLKRSQRPLEISR